MGLGWRAANQISVRSSRLRRLPALIGVLAFLAAVPAPAVADSPAPGGAGLAAAPASSQAVARALSAMTGLQPSQVKAEDACPPPAPGTATCLAQGLASTSGALVRPHIPAAHPASQATAAAAAPGSEPPGQPAPDPGTPAFLQQAYDLSWLSENAGVNDTVAVVDAFDDPTAESDLATYRSRFGLPACEAGCFQKVDQTGGTNYPAADGGWDAEISLDLDSVSALCPNCHILLVETNSNSYSDLDAGIAEADVLGAQQISNSWGGTGSDPGGTYTFAGVETLAATGDSGYLGAGEYQYPAALPDVTAVGGTTLTPASSVSTETARGFSESAWSGAGSGCDTAESKPSWQSDSGCSGRSYSDISADADPDTGMLVYDTQPDSWDQGGGWQVVGGTSEATPLTAAYYAVTGVPAQTPAWAYDNATELNDPTSGSNAGTYSCAESILYICNAGPGYDGPTGNGSISGTVVAGGPGIGGSYAADTYANSALVAGGVYPNRLDTTYWWEWGTTTSYGQQTAPQDIGSGSALASVQDDIPGLQPDTTYHVRLVAENSEGTTYGNDFTLATGTGTDDPPQSTAAPTLSGAAEQGVQLIAGPGTWSSVGTLAYQWQEGPTATGPWAGLPGATDSTYTPTEADEGGYLRVVVTDETGTGATSAPSAAAGPVTVGTPVNTNVPTVTDTGPVGSFSDGDTLIATSGTWSPTGDTITYAWQRSTDGGTTWQSIPGADASAYTLTDADVSTEVRVQVTESDPSGTVSATSTPVGVAAPPAPVNLAPPNMFWWGTFEPGTTVSTTDGYWDPGGENVTYAWQRSPDDVNWQTIPGADGTTYTLGAADEGSYIRALVTESNPGSTATAASASYGPVSDPGATPVPTPIPTFTPTPPAAPDPPPSAHAAVTPTTPTRLAVSAGTLTASRPVKLTFTAPAGVTVRVTITRLVHGKARAVGSQTVKVGRSGRAAVTVSLRFAGHRLAPGNYRVSVQSVSGRAASSAASIKLTVR